ncbi:MAG: glycoside hydrolase family 5 protein [Planctomycetota bacterium]|nr:MAG: glycoside hydrolase family 5 protein [Planctomycetota bacterium]
MTVLRRLVCAALGGLILVSAVGPVSDAGEFAIRRGVNISHWLSQSGRRGEERRAWFTEQDVAFLARCGYDHIRLPIDEEQMFDTQGNKEEEAFRLLHAGIGWALKHDLRVIVDLHILRSHHFNAAEKPLFTDPKEQERFCRLWEKLSGELNRYPVDKVAYELMNEPVADDPDDWNRIVAKAVAAIRKLEPTRVIVIGSNRWQSASTFDQLKIPEGDRNIILSFHFYEPFLVTHYRASWTGNKDYTGPIHYPGRLIRPEEIEALPPDQQRFAKAHNGEYNLDVLTKMIAKPLAVAKKTGLPLYCGEFGCIEACPRDVRLAWYRDVRTMFETHGIAWANWDYKGGFGIADSADEPDVELIRILTGVDLSQAN